MKKYNILLFDITISENKKIEEWMINLRKKVIPLLSLKGNVEFLHFSLDVEIPNAIPIESRGKTKEQIQKEIIEIYFTKILAKEYQSWIPDLLTWIEENKNPINWKEMQKQYIHNRNQNYWREEEKVPWMLIYLNQTFGSQMYLWLSTGVFTKEIIFQNTLQYFDSRFYPERIINTPEKIVKFVKLMPYGWMDKEKNIHRDSMKDWLSLYYIHDLSTILEEQIGCCIDIARIKSYFLTKLGIPQKSILIKYLDQGKIKYHAKTYFESQNIWYEMTDTYIKEIGTMEKIYTQEFGDETLSIMDLDTTKENIPLSTLLQDTFGTPRKKCLENSCDTE